MHGDLANSWSVPVAHFDFLDREFRCEVNRSGDGSVEDLFGRDQCPHACS